MQKEKEIKYAIIYCRVSSYDQVEDGNSLITQERLCREYAIKNGFTVLDEYVFIEKGESAKNVDRTELKRMMEFCTKNKGKISGIILYKLDRLSRSIDDYSQLRVFFKTLKIDILSITEKFDNSPVGKFVENMIANVSQFDNDVRTERCTNGMKEAILEGRYVWMAPVGYNNVKIDKKCTIAPSDMAHKVKELFEMIDSGVKILDEVRIEMNKRGLRTKTGKEITKQYFYKLIRNILYAGKIDKFGKITDGTFEAIISLELFLSVQKRLKNNGLKSRVYKKDNEDFPLRRFVFNESGTKKITGCYVKNKYPRYYFIKEGSAQDRDDFENKFLEFLDVNSIPETLVTKLKSKLQQKYNIKTEIQRKEIKELENIITLNENRKTKLITKNLDGLISDENLAKQLPLIEDEIIKAKSKLPKQEEVYNFDEVLELAKNYLVKPSIVWKQASPEQKIRLQWYEFPKGVVFDGKKFRTNEISFIRKALLSYDDLKSPIVDSSLTFSYDLYQSLTYLCEILYQDKT